MIKLEHKRYCTIDYFILEEENSQKKYISHAQVQATVDPQLTDWEEGFGTWIDWTNEEGDEFTSYCYELSNFANFLAIRLEENPEYAYILEDIAISS